MNRILLVALLVSYSFVSMSQSVSLCLDNNLVAYRWKSDDKLYPYEVRIWDFAQNKKTFTMASSTPIMGVEFSQTQVNVLYYITKAGSLHMVDIDKEQYIAETQKKYPNAVRLVHSYGGKYIGLISNDGRYAWVLDANTLRIIKQFAEKEEKYNGISFSQDEKYVMLAGNRGYVITIADWKVEKLPKKVLVYKNGEQKRPKIHYYNEVLMAPKTPTSFIWVSTESKLGTNTNYGNLSDLFGTKSSDRFTTMEFHPAGHHIGGCYGYGAKITSTVPGYGSFSTYSLDPYDVKYGKIYGFEFGTDGKYFIISTEKKGIVRFECTEFLRFEKQ